MGGGRWGKVSSAETGHGGCPSQGSLWPQHRGLSSPGLTCIGNTQEMKWAVSELVASKPTTFPKLHSAMGIHCLLQ